MLRDIAYRLRKRLRAFDLAYRLGGEEFLVLLPGADVDAGARRLLRTCGVAIATEPSAGLYVTMSFGVSASPPGEFDYERTFADRRPSPCMRPSTTDATAFAPRATVDQRAPAAARRQLSRRGGELAAGRVDVAPAGQPHGARQPAALELGLEGGDRLRGRALVGRAGRVVGDQVDLEHAGVEHLGELRAPGRGESLTPASITYSTNTLRRLRS